jgi:Na+:H+ antiporter, NhaA family
VPDAAASAMSQKRDVGSFGGRLEWFIHSEVTGSVLLLACTLLALAWANSPWADSYFHLLHTPIGVSWGAASFKLSLHHWINDGLMAVFFFVVGLEIKRELVVGELSSFAKAALPVAGALGGMLVPALLYLVFNVDGAGARGWGIPMATDIAFALGVLAIFGSRVPMGLKVFLTALAIADDLGAVLVIAIFYTASIALPWLLLAATLLGVLFLAIRAGVERRGILYLLIVGVWLAVFASGVHSTIAGILLAMVVPVRPRVDPRRFVDETQERLGRLRETDVSDRSLFGNREQLSALESIHAQASGALPPGLVLEHSLHPVQTWLILPLFALANAGVTFGGDPLTALRQPVALGILAGLVAGKPLGILLLSGLAVRLGHGALPEGVTWAQLAGAGCLAGIGFTMSLFVADLAFADELTTATAKLGILVASLASGALGCAVLARSLPGVARSDSA